MLPQVDVNSTLCKTDLPCVRSQQNAQKAVSSQSREAMKNVSRFNYWGLKMHHSFLLPSVLFPCCASGGEKRRLEIRLCSQPRFNVTTLYFGSKNLNQVSRARSTSFTCKSPKWAVRFFFFTEVPDLAGDWVEVRFCDASRVTPFCACASSWT